MTLSKFKILSVILISLILIPQESSTIKGCGGYDEEDIYDRSLFIPEVIQDVKYDPFFLSVMDYYNFFETQVPGRTINEYPTKEELNLSEWKTYFKGIDGTVVSEIVYQKSETHIDSIILSASGNLNSPNTPFNFFKNRKEFIDGLNYLKLAKRIEEALYRNPWDWNPKAKDFDKLKIEQKECINQFKKIKDNSIKMRYGFQYVRLCHALEEYDKGIQFVENDYLFVPADGEMFYRTHGYEAACHVKKREFSESNLWYAKLYDAKEAYKFEAFESFHPQTDIEWESTLAIAKTNREKELLWHLLGVYVDPIRGMREIAKINPKSNLLPLLLVRTINIVETQLNIGGDNAAAYSPLDYSDLSNYTVDPLFSWSSVRLEQIEGLIKTLEEISMQRDYDKDVWMISLSFLNWIQNKPEECLKWTQAALNATKNNKAVLSQAAINKLLIGFNEVSNLDQISEAKIMSLFDELDRNSKGVKRSENVRKYILGKMQEIYKQQGELTKSELSMPFIYDYYKDENQVQEMIDFMEDDNNSAWNKYLIGRYPISLSDLYDIQAVKRIYKYDFEGALSIYTLHPQTGNSQLLGNPFNSRIKDCHDCDHEMKQSKIYTKKTFVEKMLEIKAKAENTTDPNEKAINYFLYATGLYNMTYYGNARVVSASVIGNGIGETYYNCEKAELNYLIAMEHSKSKEFRAKCLWMAAKCEHNRWLESDYNQREKRDFVAGEYFKTMKELFSDTKYYSEVINECGYFCQFENPGLASCIKNKE